MSTAKPLTEPAIASQNSAADDSERVPTHGSAEMIGPEALHAIGELLQAASQYGLGVAFEPDGEGWKVSYIPGQASVGGVSASFRRAVECVRLAHRGGGRVEATRRTWRAGGELLCRARSKAGIVHPAVDGPCLPLVVQWAGGSDS
jgi:hypothetical protein